MNELIEIITSNLVPVLVTFLTAVTSYVGMSLKKLIDGKITKDHIENIVIQTVNYVEQIAKDNNLTNVEKFTEAKDKALKWLNEKNIKISDTELEIMIECAVNCLHKKNGN